MIRCTIQAYGQRSVVLLEVNPAAADSSRGRHLRFSMAVYCCPILPLASPDLMRRPKPRRDASPVSGRAQPRAPCAALCLPLFSSPLFLLSLPSMPTWPPPRPPRFMLSLASFLAPHSCCTGRMDCSEREGETLRTGQRQRTESQAIIVRRPRTPALAQLHSVHSQNGGVPSNEPE